MLFCNGKIFFWRLRFKSIFYWIYDIQVVEKCKLSVFGQLFQKVPFRGPIDLLNIFLIHHWIFLVKRLRSSTHMKILKFCFCRLYHSILDQISYFYISIWWLLTNSGFITFLDLFLMENYKLLLLFGTGKITYDLFNHFSD